MDNSTPVREENTRHEIPVHAYITPKRGKSFDHNMCAICQATSNEDLVANPTKLEKLFECVKERAGYKNPYYVDIESKIITLKREEREKCRYHRKCYSDATHKGHISRDKGKYAQVADNDQLTIPSIENTPIMFTRQHAMPYNKDLCFFCQSIYDEKGRIKLNEVEFMETGIKISNAVKQGTSDKLKVRLNNAIQSEDARAADFKYHLNCYVKNVGNEIRKVKDKCNDYYSLYKKSAEIELLSIVEREISKGGVLSIADIEITFRNILKHDYDIEEELSANYLRRYLKDLILSSICHAKSVPNKCKNMPHLIQSTFIDATILSTAIDQEEKSDMKCIFDAAKYIRNAIFLSRKANPFSSEQSFLSAKAEYPPELYAMINWIFCGSKRDISDLPQKRKDSLKEKIASCVSQIMYATKSERQISHNDTDVDFRTSVDNENKAVISRALQMRHFCRSKKVISALNKSGVCIPNYRALQIETSIANSVIRTLQANPSGIDLFPFIEKGKFIYFHFDNTDFHIDSNDGKDQLHGGLIVAFQNGATLSTPKLPCVDLKSKTLNVIQNDFTELLTCSKPNSNYFDIKQLYQIENPTTMSATINDLEIWLMLKSADLSSHQIPPWSGYFSSVTDEPTYQTNIGVFPIIPYPVTDWSTIYTALMIMRNLNKDVLGEDELTTISLDLSIYEKAIQLVYNDRIPEMKGLFNLRLGELHISMAHLRGIGSYIDGSGLESIWIECGVYGPYVARSILSCGHYKRCYNAHEVTTTAIYALLMKSFFISYPAYDKRFHDILDNCMLPKERHNKLEVFYSEIEDDLKLFKDSLSERNMCKFLFNYLAMYERSQEFIYASRSQNWQLHLESCFKLAIDFHSTDRIKYMRMMPFYIKSQLFLKDKHPFVWKSLADGQFSVVKTKKPFVALGVDHAGEQENKLLKISGGLRGIANNINARNRFFATVPVIRRLCVNVPSSNKHHNISSSKTKKQSTQIDTLAKCIESHLRPFSAEDNGVLRNLYTNAEVGDSFIHDIVNVTALGEISLTKFVNERLMENSKISLWAKVSRKNFHNFQTAMSSRGKKNQKEYGRIERNLLGKMIVALRSNRDIDQENVIGNYELNDFPPSLMCYGGLHECKDKSALIKEIYDKTTSYLLEQSLVECQIVSLNEFGIVFDGMAVVRSITKKGNSIRTVKDFGNVFIQKIEAKLHRNYSIFCVVFDPYTPYQLPKLRNKGNKTSITYQINDTTNIEKVNFTEFLSSDATKRSLTLYLAQMLHSHFNEKFQHCFSIALNQLRENDATEAILDFSHDEADTLLVWFCIYCRTKFGNNMQIDLICSDTDVLLLALNFAEQLPFNTIFKSLSYDICIGSARNALGKRVCDSLLSLHAITGSDKNGKFAGRGKLMWFRKYIEFDNESLYEQMMLFGRVATISDEFIPAISSFVAYVYTGKYVNLTKARWILFTKLKEGQDLPPTPSAFHQHCLRALWQTYEWKCSATNTMLKLDPLEYGWSREGDTYYPIPMSHDAVPSSIVELVACKCKGKCDSARYCVCKRSAEQSVCTELCQCTDLCENVDFDEVRGVDSDPEDE